MKHYFFFAGLLVMSFFYTVDTCYAESQAGAAITYQQFEAEQQETNAQVVTDETAYFTPGSEASGKSYVRMEKTGDNISFVTTAECDSLIIRFSIPDSPEGGGREESLTLWTGNKKQSILLSSKLSWVYGAFPWSNTPSEGNPHYYFDDKIIVFDEPIEKGTVIKLEKTAVDNGEYYLIDLFDTEKLPEPVAQPENSLAVTDFGAVADDGQDDTAAITEAITKSSETGQSVYFPKGTFTIYNPVLVKGILLTKNNLEVAGAGMWHTRLETKTAGFYIRGENITVKDLAIFGQTDIRRDNEPPAIAVESDTGQSKNILLENLWIEHTKVGIWANRIEQLAIKGCRIRNTLADGVNLCKGTSNSEVSNSDFRNTGDDGIAMWSSSLADTNNKIFKNTVRYPWLANNIAIYGGKDNQVYQNALYDTVGMGGGINISTRFEPQAFDGETVVRENLMIRTGSFENDTKKEYGAIWINTEPGYDNEGKILIENNEIYDSTYQGIYLFNSGTLTGMTIANNHLSSGSTYGIEVDDQAQGEVQLVKNKIEDFSKGTIHNESQLQLNDKGKQFKLLVTVLLICLLVGIVSLSLKRRKKR